MVAEARRLDDNIGQQVAVARRGDQVQDVVAARGRGDVLRQVVPLQQVVEARVQLTAVLMPFSRSRRVLSMQA